MPLSKRENFFRNARLEGAEWTPMKVHLSGASRRQLGEELEKVMARHPLFFPKFEAGAYRKPLPAGERAGDRYTDEWGCVLGRGIEGLAGAVIESPLTEWEKLKSYVPPEPKLDEAAEQARFAACRQANDICLGHVPHSFFLLRLCELRGFENCMMDLADDDERLERVKTMVVEHHLKRVRLWLKLGADAVHYGEDLGTQTSPLISPETFRRHVAPAYRTLMQPVRQAGGFAWLHSDGVILPLVDDLIECGVNILNPQDLVNGVDEIARVLKGRVCIELDIDRQKIVPFGTRAEIRELIELEVRKLGSPRGGLMFIAGIYPPTTPEQVDALCAALTEFRTFWFDGRGC
jgi:hypothetical protein